MTESYFSVNEPATKRSLNIWFYFLTLFFSFNPLSEQEFDFTSKVDFFFSKVHAEFRWSFKLFHIPCINRWSFNVWPPGGAKTTRTKSREHFAPWGFFPLISENQKELKQKIKIIKVI